MRITIETDGQEAVSVKQAELAGSFEPEEATDGGGPPQELVDLLTGEPEGPGPETETPETREPEDAGSAPEWLVGVIEGPPPTASGGLDNE